ncbi:MAG: PDGLE domain-containing protein [Bacillota bacterium]
MTHSYQGAEKTHWWILAAAILVALLLAPIACPWPDGLERVAEDCAFLGRAITMLQAPIPDYSLPGVPGGASTALAGLLGVLVTFAAVWWLSRVVVHRTGRHC